MKEIKLGELLTIIDDEQSFYVCFISPIIETKTKFLYSENKDDLYKMKKFYSASIVRTISCGYDNDLEIYCEV